MSIGDSEPNYLIDHAEVIADTAAGTIYRSDASGNLKRLLPSASIDKSLTITSRSVRAWTIDDEARLYATTTGGVRDDVLDEYDTKQHTLQEIHLSHLVSTMDFVTTSNGRIWIGYYWDPPKDYNGRSSHSNLCEVVTQEPLTATLSGAGLLNSILGNERHPILFGVYVHHKAIGLNVDNDGPTNYLSSR